MSEDGKGTLVNRALAKTLTYRLGAFMIGCVIFMPTLGVWVASNLVLLDVIAATLYYYAHERLYRRLWPQR